MNGVWYERVLDDAAEDDHRDGTCGMLVVERNDRVRQGQRWAKNAMLTKHKGWIGEWDKEKRGASDAMAEGLVQNKTSAIIAPGVVSAEREPNPV